MPGKIELLDTHCAWRGNFITVMRTGFRNKAGAEGMWEYMERNGVVFIFPITTAGDIVVIKQFRVAQRNYVIEMPAGLCDKPHEPPIETAKRELFEETGSVAEQLFEVLPAPRGASAGIAGPVHVFIATGVERKAEVSGDENEDIEVLFVPFSELVPFALSQPHEIRIDAMLLATHAIAKHLKDTGKLL